MNTARIKRLLHPHLQKTQTPAKLAKSLPETRQGIKQCYR